MEAYVAFILKDIELTPAEQESITLTKQDYKDMSAPLATFTAKTDWAKKHGRTVIGATDSIESVLALGIWMRRVHRIARAHHPEAQARAAARKQRRAVPTVARPQQTQPVVQPAPVAAQPETFTRPTGEQLAAMAAGHLDQQQASPIYTGGSVNGNTGQAASEGIRKPQPPGAYGGGFTGNPGTG
jgi:hypothetical protein